MAKSHKRAAWLGTRSWVPRHAAAIDRRAILLAAHAQFRLSSCALGRPNRFSHAVAVALGVLAAVGSSGCSTVNAGSNFSVPEETFNEDYFYCHVEPQLIMAKRCGSGDPGAGDPSGGCHFNAAAVSGMALVDHPPIDCGGGDRPVSRGALGTGSAARGNLQAVSLVMSRDYLTAPLYLRPTGANHPRAVFGKDDPVVDIIRTWAQKP